MTRRTALALALAMLIGPPAGAADLAAARRPPAREPAYKNAPRYCLLVFGPQAQFRVWLVQDGDALYVDRNGDGDLTAPGKRVAPKQEQKNFRTFEAGDLADGKLTHTGLVVSQLKATADFAGNAGEFARITRQEPEGWVWTVHVAAERPADDTRPLPRRIGYVANGDGLGYLLFAPRPQDAPVIHFNGPWTLGLQDVKQRLTAGRKTELQIGVGTPGEGPGTFAFVLYPDTIPADVYPVAEITYPPRAKGDPPPAGRYVLKDRC